MALGVLGILFIALAFIAIILQILLYKNTSKRKSAIFISNTLLGLVLSYLAYTSLPVNATGQRSLAIGLGAVAILAILLKFMTEKYELTSKLLISIAIVGSFIQLFL